MYLAYRKKIYDHHDGQVYGKMPYKYHLEGCRLLLERYSSDMDRKDYSILKFVVIAHDVIEDCITKDELLAILKAFSIDPIVADAVDLISKRQQDGCRNSSNKESYSRFNSEDNLLLKKLSATAKYIDRLFHLKFISKRVASGSPTSTDVRKEEVYRVEHKEFCSTYSNFILSEKLRDDVNNFYIKEINLDSDRNKNNNIPCR